MAAEELYSESGRFRAAWHIDRSDVGRKIAQAVLAAERGVVFVYGQHGTGKTQLIEKWVTPVVAKERTVYTGVCEPDIPNVVAGRGDETSIRDALAADAVVVLDSFEKYLSHQASARGWRPELVTAKLEELASDAGGLLVIVVDQSQLGVVFTLRSESPDLVRAVVQVEPLSVERELPGLGERPLQYAPEVLETLSQEIGALPEGHGGVGPELVKVLHLGFNLHAEEFNKQDVQIDDYNRIGGLVGVLRLWIDRRLRDLKSLGEDEHEVAWALLEELVDATSSGRTPDPSSIPARLDTTDERCEEILGWLETPAGLVTKRKDGTCDLVPLQLRAAVEQRMAATAQRVQPVFGILEQAVESWHRLDVLLTMERFRQVHENRKDLRVAPDEAEFMLQCALLHYTHVSGAARYWFRRVQNESVKLDVLACALFDQRAHVRARAASLLQGFDQPEVRDHLHVLALEDPDEGVRDRAIESLRNMSTEELRALILQEVEDKNSAYRDAALTALRIFPDAETAGYLQAMVNDPDTELELRAKAVQVLASLEEPSAADALIGIALEDEDVEDRQAAADALASTEQKDLLDHIFRRLHDHKVHHETRQRPITVGALFALCGKVLASLGLVAVTVLFHGAILLAIGRILPGVILSALGIGCVLAAGSFGTGSLGMVVVVGFHVSLGVGLAWPVGILLKQRKRLELAPYSFRSVLSVILFVANSFWTFLFFLPGLAHALTGRVRRGFFIFSLRLLAVVLFVLLAWVEFWQPPFFPDWLLDTYFLVTLALILAPWAWDVIGVFIGSILHNAKAVSRRRRHALYERLLVNPVAAQQVLDAQESSDPKQKEWAGRVIRRFLPHFPPELVVEHLAARSIEESGEIVVGLYKDKRSEIIGGLKELWSREERRPAIVDILCRNPTERSLDALRSLWDDLTWKARTRYGLARAHFLFRVWPRTVIAAGVLVLPILLMLATSAIYISFINPAWRTVRMVERGGSVGSAWIDQDARVAAVVFLAKVHRGEAVDVMPRLLGNPAIPIRVRLEIIPLLDDIAEDLYDWEDHSVTAESTLREKVDENLFRDVIAVLKQDVFTEDDIEMRAAAVEALDILITYKPDESVSYGALDALSAVVLDGGIDRETRSAALDAITGAGYRATDALESIVAAPIAAQQSSAAQPRTGLPELGTQEQSTEANPEAVHVLLRQEAIAALGRIATPEAYAALEQLSTAPAVDPRLASTLDAFELTEESVYRAYDAGDWETTVRSGELLLSRRQDRDPELLHLVGKASYFLAEQGATQERTEELLSSSIAYINEANDAGRVDPDAMWVLSLAYADTGSNHFGAAEYADAIEAFEMSTRVNPSAYWSHYMLGVIHARQLDYARSAEAAIASIRANPDYEFSYALLREAYEAEGRLDELEPVLLKFREEFRYSVWPARNLSFLYHEHLSETDADAYAKAREQLVHVRGLLERDLGVESEWVENNLTAGDHAATIEAGQELLQDELLSDDLRLHVNVFVYAAELLSGRYDDAAARLDEIEALHTEVWTVTWVYEGTARYLRRSALVDDLKTPLLDMVEIVWNQPEADIGDAIEANRRALAARRDMATVGIQRKP